MNVEDENVDIVLELVRESEKLRRRLRVSIRSFSSLDDLTGEGLRGYLRDLEFQLESVRHNPADE